MESGHGSGTPIGQVDLSEKALVYSHSLTSTSSSDNFEDTFELNGNEFTKIDTDSPTTLADGSRVSGEPATQSPPKQVMERPAESTYRIPSSVFETNESNETDWSSASNESLFSLNVSFKTDALSLLGKSGDLKESSTSLSSPLVDSEAAAVQTMREVIRENEERQSKEQFTKPMPVVANGLDHSPVSIQSFAFGPAPTGKGGHSKGSEKSQPATPTSPKSESQSPTKQQTPKTTKKKWLSYFSWCHFCK